MLVLKRLRTFIATSVTLATAGMALAASGQPEPWQLACRKAVLLFLIIFFWTPPHFWALALFRTEDYARARIPVLPVVSGDASTRRQIMRYTLILVPLGVAPWAFGYAGALYGTTAIAAGAIMTMLGWQVLREIRPAERASRNLFAFSILYLFLLFAVLLIERGWGGLIARLAA
jgi:protoheme IX farnesyltransferase